MNGHEDDDDHGAFAREMADVKPLDPPDFVVHDLPRPKPRPRQREADEAAVMQELLDDPLPEEGLETGEELAFLRAGYQKRYLDRLRRGRYAVLDRIDLHGMNEATAEAVLLAFIEDALRRGHGCVKVVHGKGLRSNGRPKLKVMTARLLRRHPAVVAFASCRPRHGGTGAALVLLARRA
ncbi:SMR domain protein [Marinihelvus fidelis]|uniref:SMR domain protein n=1 Tax=Marinihelvus fidelis TaxID=2613842 RepID=A0A5N0TBT1_9GAMM|nr:Smr/MutS family protein [Marinihelvus fidelis]KAA9132485.1 SMR domain protein [Marinihelvus fidelis]